MQFFDDENFKHELTETSYSFTVEATGKKRLSITGKKSGLHGRYISMTLNQEEITFLADLLYSISPL